MVEGNLHLGTFDAERIKGISAEILRRTRARKDVVASRAKLDVEAFGPTVNGPPIALVVKNGEEHRYPLKRSALLQLAGSLDVPTRYLDRLTDAGHLDLAAANLGELLGAEPDAKPGVPRKHLVRLLDGQVDAFLSDRYRTISHEDVLAICAEETARAGAEIWDLRLTDTEFRFLAAAPHISGQVTTDRKFTGASRWEGKAGDVLNAAVTIRNSETGHGAFRGEPAILRRVCQNFCIWGDGVARVHLGKQLEEGEHAFTSEATKSLEDRALISKLRDVIRTTFDPAKFRAAIDAINATTQRELGDSPIAVVDASIRAFGLDASRRDAILSALLSTGDVSQYGLTQAITAQVNPENAQGLDDATRNAFEDAGGTLLRLSEGGWKRFLADAYRPKRDDVEAARETVSVRRT